MPPPKYPYPLGSRMLMPPSKKVEPVYNPHLFLNPKSERWLFIKWLYVLLVKYFLLNFSPLRKLKPLSYFLYIRNMLLCLYELIRLPLYVERRVLKPFPSPYIYRPNGMLRVLRSNNYSRNIIRRVFLLLKFFTLTSL